ncbi:hypothetical protein Theam_0028 [Thermovibrio ammonificans HB-1]|uniref:IstB domain protein ATP-binding protein n=1 Tax=Thermovibrio ammonificans (strain DSM 15698 / JCM 12110 / HB-1) TaxID=648996 RepID=E8T2S7_THEA1|nr:ATP-binding protein [Thermovibrio ammonificans]ADU96002.1 hypothetical protein Theam_0028 [Thermovibrio ammonificans HB-1]
MQVATLEALKKQYPECSIIEQDNLYFVLTEGRALKFLKPRRKEQIKEILLEGNFPKRYIDRVLGSEKKKTEALQVALSAPKGLFLIGSAGVGKTYACVYKIAYLLKNLKVNRPLYLPLQNIKDVFETKKALWDYDSFLLDDLNPNLGEWERKLVIEVIYHAYNEEKLLFITSNASFKAIAHFLKEEPVVSRLLEICDVKTVKGEDLRLATVNRT